MAIGRFKLSFTTEESKIPSLVCQAPSDSENVEGDMKKSLTHVCVIQFT